MKVKLSSENYLPKTVSNLENLNLQIPKIAKNQKLIFDIETAVQDIPTFHNLHLADSRRLSFIPEESVHLILTSPPYWTLKKYRDNDRQLGEITEYEEFIRELNKVWRHCYRVLVPGGRLVCVVGDVCLSRRKNMGRHTVVPLHATVQESCRAIGFDNLSPIIWYKIANANYEASGNGGFLGKPYEPNAIIKNDIEFILMERKSGGYRKPSLATRVLSVISESNQREWFQQIWRGITGAQTGKHPAPYPVELAERLVRMFSFVGDTVLDPFMGTGTTNISAAKWGRNSIGIEIDPYYKDIAIKRLKKFNRKFSSKLTINKEES